MDKLTSHSINYTFVFASAEAVATTKQLLEEGGLSRPFPARSSRSSRKIRLNKSY